MFLSCTHFVDPCSSFPIEDSAILELVRQMMSIVQMLLLMNPSSYYLPHGANCSACELANIWIFQRFLGVYT